MSFLVLFAALAWLEDPGHPVFSEKPVDHLSEAAVIEWFAIHRKEMKETNKAKIDALTKDMKAAKQSGDRELAKRLEKRIRAEQRQMSELKRSHPPVPMFDFARARVGYFGRFDMTDSLDWFVVEKVTSKGSMICTRRFQSAEQNDNGFFIVRGVPVDAVEVKSPLYLSGVFRVTDRVKLGEELRLVIEPFDPEPAWKKSRSKDKSPDTAER
ncbi:MAG: hypothetical protein NT069_08715 [Planctomycetota bacterium]|nr:hypothetical protein [Planctomycetota bacterium]